MGIWPFDATVLNLTAKVYSLDIRDALNGKRLPIGEGNCNGKPIAYASVVNISVVLPANLDNGTPLSSRMARDCGPNSKDNLTKIQIEVPRPTWSVTFGFVISSSHTTPQDFYVSCESMVESGPHATEIPALVV